MTKNVNHHIEEFLEYYYNRLSSPEYAVLIKGRWGTGKTWFIKKSLQALENSGGKYLHISLNGITSFEAIENEFFRKIHPFLASKEMAFAGKVFRGLLKATIKFDVNGDGKDDASLSPQLPDIKIPEYLTNTDGFVLVFDDIERCSIPVADLFGYINHFVEHSGLKVILVANEEEILNFEKGNEGRQENQAMNGIYRRIKEKLIGKTFEIIPDIDAAIASFLAEFGESPAKKAFRDNEDAIRDLYIASKYHNLRHLKQALLDLERLFNKLSSDIFNNKPLVSDILKRFLVFSFEIKSGEMNPSEIAKISSSFYARIGAGSKESEDPENLYNRLSNKYQELDFLDQTLSDHLWVEMFNSGMLNIVAIEESLNNSSYVESARQPSWVRLWRVREMKDVDLQGVLDDVLYNFHNGKYKEIGEILHVAGILIMLAKNNIYKKSLRQIVADAKSQIDVLAAEGLLLTERQLEPVDYWGSGFAGLMFAKSDSTEFKAILKYLDGAQQRAIINRYPEQARALLELMASDTDSFSRALTLTNHEDNLFYRTPILGYMKDSEFVECYLMLEPRQQNMVGSVIRRRYESQNVSGDLKLEKEWLKRVGALLQKKCKKNTGAISVFRISQLIEDINHAVKKI